MRTPSSLAAEEQPATLSVVRVNGTAPSHFVERFTQGMTQALAERGLRMEGTGGPVEDLRLVFNLFPASLPRPYRRHAQSVFVVGVTEAPERDGAPSDPHSVLRAAYPLLVRSISNLLIYLAPRPQGVEAFFVTLERGCYSVRFDGNARRFFTEVSERVLPLATSHLIIDNIFETKLPRELSQGDENTQAIGRAGRLLADLDLLPAPFPMQDLLAADDFRHVQRLFGIGGLSYGNVSVRKDAGRFWMSASGVDKGNLHLVGRDIQLVTGYDAERRAMILSVPPGMSPRRVSVDAIEHWMIYREHPQVGAILHVHAWMPGVRSTEVNYPCGTFELATAVAGLVREAPDASRAVIGLRNHGLTITGRNLDELLAGIDGRLLRQVPMT